MRIKILSSSSVHPNIVWALSIALYQRVRSTVTPAGSALVPPRGCRLRIHQLPRRLLDVAVVGVSLQCLLCNGGRLGARSRRRHRRCDITGEPRRQGRKKGGLCLERSNGRGGPWRCCFGLWLWLWLRLRLRLRPCLRLRLRRQLVAPAYTSFVTGRSCTTSKTHPL